MPETSSETTAVITDHGDNTPSVVATQPLKWWQIILIRATRSSIDAFMATSVFTSVTTGGGLEEAALLLAFKVAGFAFISAALRNAAELLAKFDQTNPSLRA